MSPILVTKTINCVTDHLPKLPLDNGFRQYPLEFFFLFVSKPSKYGAGILDNNPLADHFDLIIILSSNY